MKGKSIAVILFTILLIGIKAEEEAPANEPEVESPPEQLISLTDRLCLVPQMCMDKCIKQSGGRQYGICMLQGMYVKCVCQGPVGPPTTLKPKDCVVQGKCSAAEDLYCCGDKSCYFSSPNDKYGVCTMLEE